jgi:hypothetical protein
MKKQKPAGAIDGRSPKLQKLREQQEHPTKIRATDSMLESLKKAVQSTEDSWDAQRDLEVECGKDFDGLSQFVADLAVAGAEGVTLQDLQDFIDEDED